MPRKAVESAAGKRVPLNMKTTEDVRAKLEEAAAASGRSLTAETENRLMMSFEWEKAFRKVELLNEQEAVKYLVKAGWPSIPGTPYGLVFAQPGSFADLGDGRAAEVLPTPSGMNMFRLGPVFDVTGEKQAPTTAPPAAPAPTPARAVATVDLDALAERAAERAVERTIQRLGLDRPTQSHSDEPPDDGKAAKGRGRKSPAT